MDRFLRVTHPSATRGCPLVRLACVKHAASVRSEPGSNSQVHHVQPRKAKPTNKDPNSPLDPNQVVTGIRNICVRIDRYISRHSFNQASQDPYREPNQTQCQSVSITTKGNQYTKDAANVSLPILIKLSMNNPFPGPGGEFVVVGRRLLGGGPTPVNDIPRRRGVRRNGKCAVADCGFW